MTPEQQARQTIDQLHTAAGWDVQDVKAVGIVDAKRQGATLTGVEALSARYAQGLPAAPPAHRRPLPFLYESTGLETHCTNRLDPEPRVRNVFAFHRPKALAAGFRRRLAS